MAAEEMGCSGSGKSEASSLDRVITYKRRKRENGCISAPGKDTKEPHDSMSCCRVYDQDQLVRIGSHRKLVLEHFLKLPDVSNCGGIHKCIQDALNTDPFELTEKLERNVLRTTYAEDRCLSGKGDHHSERPDTATNATSVGSKSGACGEAEVCFGTEKCRSVFLDILLSQSFALLCDLLCENFQDKITKNMFNFSMINSKMTDGVYEQSSQPFVEDILQVWENFQKVGQEMVRLASSLIKISQASYKKQVGEDLIQKDGKQKCEGSGQAAGEEKIPADSYMNSLIPYESDHSNRLVQTEGSGLYKVFTCKHCGGEADGENSLVCDGCEAMYHLDCVKPTVQNIPTQSWYCTSCSTKRKDASVPLSCSVQHDGLHENCVVCDRLGVSISENKKHQRKNGKEKVIAKEGDISVSTMEPDEPLQPAKSALLHLCKYCGTSEEEDKKFLVCGNTLCLYRFYHIRCLKNSQLASREQQSQHCWYCPSCLCRACLTDKDDDKIVMCDGCDEAYHIYCMKPKLPLVPNGKWFCALCNAERAKQGMRLYEQRVLKLHGVKDGNQAKVAKKSGDVSSGAALKLNSGERLTAGKKGK